MGIEEATTPSKSEKASSPAQEQPMVHPYPDWAAVQAYYGPGVPMPSPYFNATVAPGHPPHPYMWAPQPLVPPFATPYPVVYPHGIYSHPSAGPMGSPPTTDMSAKSLNSKNKGLMKRLKGFDGLAVSIGNVNAEIAVGDESGPSRSEENGADGSSDASNDNHESEGKENPRKRSLEDSPNSGDKKPNVIANVINSGETTATPNVTVGVAVSPSIECKPMCTLPASCQTPGVEFRTSTSGQLKAGVHPELWTQDERALKREKRKQSNRESARRSRLRKQAETEELAIKVDLLGRENAALKSEISEVKENLEKLSGENSSLMNFGQRKRTAASTTMDLITHCFQGKLKSKQCISHDNLENQESPSVVVENFLSRIDELKQDENNENPKGGKLHQLLDPSPRTDAVAAG